MPRDALMLTLFQVWPDLERAQYVYPTAGDLPGELLVRPKDGESILGRPWHRTLQVDAPPEVSGSNFFILHTIFLLMDMKAKNACQPALEPCGEFLSFELEGVGEVFLFNPLDTLKPEVVDWSATKYSYGTHSNLTLNKDLIPAPAIFRMPRMGDLFISSRLEEDERDFYFLFHKHGLTGLDFKKLWDERSGPVPNLTTAPGANT